MSVVTIETQSYELLEPEKAQQWVDSLTYQEKVDEFIRLDSWWTELLPSDKQLILSTTFYINNSETNRSKVGPDQIEQLNDKRRWTSLRSFWGVPELEEQHNYRKHAEDFGRIAADGSIIKTTIARF